MGMDFHAYVGPYLKLKQKYKDVPVKTYACDNPAGPNHKSDENAKFCSKCGSPIVATTKVEREAESVYVILEEFGEDLTVAHVNDDEYIYLVSNHRAEPREFSYSEQDDQCIHEIKQKEETDWFLEEHKDSIEGVNRHYGKTELIFGVLTYCY